MKTVPNYLTYMVAAVTGVKVWILDRKVFQQIMMRTGLQRLEDNLKFLKSVPLLQNLSNDVLAKIADSLEVVSIFFEQLHFVVKYCIIFLIITISQ